MLSDIEYFLETAALSSQSEPVYFVAANFLLKLSTLGSLRRVYYLRIYPRESRPCKWKSCKLMPQLMASFENSDICFLHDNFLFCLILPLLIYVYIFDISSQCILVL